MRAGRLPASGSGQGNKLILRFKKMRKLIDAAFPDISGSNVRRNLNFFRLNGLKKCKAGPDL
jgi:hypothetical protein